LRRPETRGQPAEHDGLGAGRSAARFYRRGSGGRRAKGNTLLNYCGIGTDFVDYTVDRNPHKQGTLLPGSHIPIRAPEELERTRPDLVLILPWNIRDEVIEQMAYIRDWGERFVVPVPEPRIC
jgi:hypothetical protein